GDHTAVVAGAARRVEGDHVDALRAGGAKDPRHFDRVIGVDLRVAVVALCEAHAPPPEDVDGGDHDHAAHGAPVGKRLAVIGELERDGDVFRLPQRLDHQLQGVFVLADDAELTALDPNLTLRRHVLDPLADGTGELVRDAGGAAPIDLAAA